MRLIIKTKYQVPGGPRPGTRHLTTAGIVLACAATVVLAGIVAWAVLR